MAYGKGEELKERINDGNGNSYEITCRDIDTWYIYQNGKKLGKGSSPYNLEDKYIKYAEGTDIPEPILNEETLTPFELLAREHKRLGIDIPVNEPENNEKGKKENDGK